MFGYCVYVKVFATLFFKKNLTVSSLNSEQSKKYDIITCNNTCTKAHLGIMSIAK